MSTQQQTQEALSVEIQHDHGMQVAEGWGEHHAYMLAITVSGRTHHGITWRQGLGVETSPTETPQDVLDALISDADSGSYTFEDFCAEYGYDEDSRKAYATWEACAETSAWLPALLDTDPENIWSFHSDAAQS